MTTQTEALKLALECAERCENIDGMYSWGDTITAIKEALAQPEQEPRTADEKLARIKAELAYMRKSQPEQEQSGFFSREAMKDHSDGHVAQQEQEPVAWIYKSEPFFDGNKWHDTFKVTTIKQVALWKDKAAKPLYTTPPQRKPLTDEQWMIEMVDAAMVATRDIVPRITRSQCRLIIEAAHGIKE